jgi:hypothetical protein
MLDAIRAYFAWIVPAVSTTAGLLLVAAWLHLNPKLGSLGRAVAAACCRAPLLDAIVALMTWVPWVLFGVLYGWRGLLASLAGQMVALGVWCFLHEQAHPAARKGPRIVKSLNRIVGRAPNHLALWATLIAVPAFWSIRFGQLLAYPLLILIVDFPRYRHAEWVNVSRQKFGGLVGHDLIWCLYCDWMTGVYSLGAEMLRNVESFWCPIRFYDGKKCENCKVDFPDIDKGWVAADGTMADVAHKVEEKYAGGRREWFNHPARLTVNGKDVQSSVPQVEPLL